MSLYIKISNYSTINNITKGLFIALASAASLYLDWFGFVNYLLNTILGLLSFYYLLKSDKKVWFWFGFFMATLCFWWISISFKNYGFAWAIPIGIFLTSTLFAFLLGLLAMLSEWIANKTSPKHSFLLDLLAKSVILLFLSTVHPFGFDWYKPELVFTNSYIGIEKWQFSIVLLSIILSIYKKQLLYLFLLFIAFPYASYLEKPLPLEENIEVTNFNINVKDKWEPTLQQRHIDLTFSKIDKAIQEKKSLIILPESIFALFLNKQPQLMESLLLRSKKIDIVLGALYWDEKTPRNSTYIFSHEQYQIVNKVVLVPFGESNPLPDWMGKWINLIFFDGAPDYVAANNPVDYKLMGQTFRNAICYEACSEKLYEGKPKNMIVLSNNGWVVPSIEPTMQKILLQYYSKKYGTTIYHSINMSPSYIIHGGKLINVQ